MQDSSTIPVVKKRTKAEIATETLLKYRQNGKKAGVPTKAMAKVHALNMSTWEEFTDFVNNEGLELFKENMLQLDPKSYIIAYLQLMEYIRPKLTRSTNVNESTINVDSIVIE